SCAWCRRHEMFIDASTILNFLSPFRATDKHSAATRLSDERLSRSSLHLEPCALRLNDVVFHSIDLLLRSNYLGQYFRLHTSASGWSRQTSFLRASISVCCSLIWLCC